MGMKKIKVLLLRAVRQGSLLYTGLFVIASLACAQSAFKDSNSSSSSATPDGMRHYDIKLADLPPPEVQKGPVNFSKVIPKPDTAQLTLPPGFSVETYAEGDLK